jgi:hypothetical protein
MNMNRLTASPSQNGAKTYESTGNLGSPKRFRETAEKLRLNEDRLKEHGAVHLGKDLANYEPKQFLGSGNLLNGAL